MADLDIDESYLAGVRLLQKAMQKEDRIAASTRTEGSSPALTQDTGNETRARTVYEEPFDLSSCAVFMDYQVMCEEGAGVPTTEELPDSESPGASPPTAKLVQVRSV